METAREALANEIEANNKGVFKGAKTCMNGDERRANCSQWKGKEKYV